MLLVCNLLVGVFFDGVIGMLSWMFGYDQVGIYNDIVVVVSDGKYEVQWCFNIMVEQGWLMLVFLVFDIQVLCEGDCFVL